MCFRLYVHTAPIFMIEIGEHRECGRCCFVTNGSMTCVCRVSTLSIKSGIVRNFIKMSKNFDQNGQSELVLKSKIFLKDMHVVKLHYLGSLKFQNSEVLAENGLKNSEY